MLINKLLGNQSIIITLDVDNFLFDKLEQIEKTKFTLIEVNATDPELLMRIINQYPKIKLGAGGIINTQQLENCYQAGVQFASSPGFLPAIAQTANVYSMNYFPGVATASEAMAAIELGCQQIRPFPANPTFCKLLYKYFPSVGLFPAEIEWDATEHFMNIPSVAAVSILNPNSKQLQALASAEELILNDTSSI